MQRKEAPKDPALTMTQPLRETHRMIEDGLRTALKTLREIVYGMTVHDWVHELEKMRGEQERLFITILFGNLLGIPILPPYYTLRLLPYIAPTWEAQRRSLLRERDLTDLFDQEIG